MPAALKVDWSLAESLFQEGVALRGISLRTGIPYETVKKRAKRHGWTQLMLPPKGSLSIPVSSLRPIRSPISSKPDIVTPDRASRWQNRVGNMVESCMSRLEDKVSRVSPDEDINLDTVEQIVRVTEMTDRTARRTFGLDVERSDRHVTLHLQSELSSPAQSKQLSQGEIVDVETVDGPKLSGNSQESPTNPTKPE